MDVRGHGLQVLRERQQAPLEGLHLKGDSNIFCRSHDMRLHLNIYGVEFNTINYVN
jgi:hypothetical protein